MAKFHSFTNLGDKPGHTHHRPHGGMKYSVTDERHHANGGRAHEEPHEDEEEEEGHAYGGRVRLQRGGRGEGTDSSLSDTGARDHPKHGYQYNAAGSPTMREATDATPSFGRGGRKRKAGGTAGGMMAMSRMDHPRRQRGGSARAPARTPYSTGSSLSPPSSDREGRGYEGVKPA